MQWQTSALSIQCSPVISGLILTKFTPSKTGRNCAIHDAYICFSFLKSVWELFFAVTKDAVLTWDWIMCSFRFQLSPFIDFRPFQGPISPRDPTHFTAYISSFILLGMKNLLFLLSPYCAHMHIYGIFTRWRAKETKWLMTLKIL